MGHFIVRIISFIIVYALLYFIWAYWSDMKLFPKNIIGTYYEVSLPNNYKLTVNAKNLFTSITDSEDVGVVNGIDSLQAIGDVVIGRDVTGFFSFETKAQKYTTYSSAEQLKQAQSDEVFSLLSPIDFYWHHRRPYDILANIIIAVISGFCSYFAGKVFLEKDNQFIKKRIRL